MPEDEWEEVEGEVWIPKEKDEEISGIYLGVQHEVGVNKSELYTLEFEGKQITFWGAKILDSKMLSAKEGQEIKVVFLGTVKPEKGNEYKDFKVFKKPLK